MLIFINIIFFSCLLSGNLSLSLDVYLIQTTDIINISSSVKLDDSPISIGYDFQ